MIPGPLSRYTLGSAERTADEQTSRSWLPSEDTTEAVCRVSLIRLLDTDPRRPRLRCGPSSRRNEDGATLGTAVSDDAVIEDAVGERDATEITEHVQAGLELHSGRATDDEAGHHGVRAARAWKGSGAGGSGGNSPLRRGSLPHSGQRSTSAFMLAPQVTQAMTLTGPPHAPSVGRRAPLPSRASCVQRTADKLRARRPPVRPPALRRVSLIRLLDAIRLRRLIRNLGVMPHADHPDDIPRRLVEEPMRFDQDLTEPETRELRNHAAGLREVKQARQRLGRAVAKRPRRGRPVGPDVRRVRRGTAIARAG